VHGKASHTHAGNRFRGKALLKSGKGRGWDVDRKEVVFRREKNEAFHIGMRISIGQFKVDVLGLG